MQLFTLKKDTFFDSKENLKSQIVDGFMKKVLEIVHSKPFGEHKFYDFIFPKRADEQSFVQILFHQPRLTKPNPLPGTTLLRLNPKDPDEIGIIWTLPHEEAFHNYQKGKIYSDPIVYQSIQNYLHNREYLMKPEPDDPSEEECKRIYQQYINKPSKNSS